MGRVVARQCGRGARRRVLGVAAAAVIGSIASGSFAAPQYTLLDLGTFGGTSSKAYDINSSGQIVGLARTATGVNLAFRTSPYSALSYPANSLGTLTGGTRSEALGINDAGTVTGDGDSPSGDRAFRYASSMTNLGTIQGSWSYGCGINATGQVAGYSSVGNGSNADTHAFLYSGSQMFNLQTLGGSGNGLSSYGQAINAGGSVVGFSNLDASQNWIYHAFKWTPAVTNGTTGTMSDLGTLGGNYSYAYGINDRNQVVGGAYLADDSTEHALRWWSGTKTDLGTLGGTFSEAYDTNLHGDIVGSAATAGGANHAFLYTDLQLYDLNSLIPAGSGWVLQNAQAINNSGYIVGWGKAPDGQTRAVLLSPVTPHSSAWNVDAIGNWSVSGNWAFGVPNAPDVGASFGNAITTARTLTVDGPFTTGRIMFDNPAAYTIAGPGAITLDVTSGYSSISTLLGNHTIAAPLVLADDVLIKPLLPGGTFTISGAVSSSGTHGIIHGGPGTLVLSGNNTYAGTTSVAGGILTVGASSNLGASTNSVSIEGGTLRITGPVMGGDRGLVATPAGGMVEVNAAAEFGTLTGSGTLSKTGSATLTFNGINVTALAVNAGAVALKPRGAGGPRVARLQTLLLGGTSSAPTTTLDLNDNDLVFDYGTSPSPFGVLRQLVFAGYSPTPDPSKTGIISSVGQSAGNTILALFDNALVGAGDWPLGSGQTIGPNSIVGKYTYFGDANLDGQVSADDYAILDSNLSSTPAVEIAWLAGDANLDGAVTADDYAILDGTLGSGASQPLAPVPEPLAGTSAALLGAGLLLRRQRPARAT